ncbi:MAG TPA: hypothetical protein VHG93_04455 [Longimicrobium sp.]|nr:hypothetical protein [Longimicrobium sp.]
MRIHLLVQLTAALVLAAGFDSLHAAPAVAADTARMRRALAEAFGDDVEIARTELTQGLPERSGTFWLVYARPRRSGNYHLRYRYDYRDPVRPNDPLYTRVEHTSVIRVGERGCWRRREGRDVCLGDTIILPFVAGFTGHTFHVTRRALEENGTLPALPVRADTAGSGAVPNPLSAHLRYLGSGSYEMLRRSGGGNVFYNATFEAVAPGRFNLAVASREADEDAPPVSSSGSVPVIIVPRGEPVTVLLQNETVVGMNGNDGFSSHSGNQYLTTVLILQPGDRITLDYGSRALPRPGRDRVVGFAAAWRRGALGAPTPVIAGFPFHLDLDERFNAWIAPHLPAEPRR